MTIQKRLENEVTQISPEEFVITKDQLEGLLAYYKMYGVTEMKFFKNHFHEAIQDFGINPVKFEFGPPMGGCGCFFIPKDLPGVIT